MTVTLDYELTGQGWARCALRVADSFVEVSASYLSDALGNLCRAVISLLEGEVVVRTSFDEEPGEYRWVMERTSETVRVRILEFGELWSNLPDESGRAIFDALCPLSEFALALVVTLSELWGEYGETRYRERWGEHDFPTSEMHRLGELLAKVAPN
jgi:hypothetical protein